MDWIVLEWRALVNTVMSILVPQNVRKIIDWRLLRDSAP
jgi:hypothetical protein